MRKRLLVVEHEPDIAAVIRMSFDPARYVIRSAGTLAAARKFVSSRSLHLVILDTVLPDGDGLDLCRALKGTHPSLPVVVLATQPGIRDEARAAGADLFMMEPFDPDELAAEVERLLGGA